ncbi:hypothetical protein CEXT_703661 [Caerostris extrusa]|uniref:Uncharacterized protein n=1 Tax=Caerostris extrusa TaxID=172846 RepID=A0AAV4MDL7_CAEEX|nr:hypothetical protein CEXT_703661 [Caerostris extrusa]
MNNVRAYSQCVYQLKIAEVFIAEDSSLFFFIVFGIPSSWKTVPFSKYPPLLLFAVSPHGIKTVSRFERGYLSVSQGLTRTKQSFY